MRFHCTTFTVRVAIMWKWWLLFLKPITAWSLVLILSSRLSAKSHSTQLNSRKIKIYLSTLEVAVKCWCIPQTASHTYYNVMMQSLLPTCFNAKKEDPKVKFNSKAKSVCTENYSCVKNSHNLWNIFLPT